MRTKTPARRTVASLSPFAAVIAVAALGACSYLETQMQRTAPPDTRIKLNWQDRVQLTASEITNYTCESRYLLMCDRAGSITYSCTCELR